MDVRHVPDVRLLVSSLQRLQVSRQRLGTVLTVELSAVRHAGGSTPADARVCSSGTGRSLA